MLYFLLLKTSIRGQQIPFNEICLSIFFNHCFILCCVKNCITKFWLKFLAPILVKIVVLWYKMTEICTPLDRGPFYYFKRVLELQIYVRLSPLLVFYEPKKKTYKWLPFSVNHKIPYFRWQSTYIISSFRFIILVNFGLPVSLCLPVFIMDGLVVA